MKFGQNLLSKIAIIRHSIKINPYIFSLFSFLLTLGIRWLFDPFLENISSLIIFITAILISAWYGGFGTGMLTTIISVGYLSIYQHPAQPDKNNESLAIPLIILFIEGLIISLISEAGNKFEKEHSQILLNEKIARRNAEQQARIRDHFISIASHELKSPITGQKAYLQLLKKNVKKNNHIEYENYLHKIENQTDKLTNFINDLLDVTKMNSKKLQYNYSFFDLKGCIQEAIDSIKSLLVTHEVEYAGDIKRQIYGDKERIYQVISNLLSNAIKYSPEANKIIISYSENKKNIIVSVKDFGVGINPDHLEKIFNRFFRVTDIDESHFKGLGLGLYLSAQIIKKHKGKIWAESTGIGKGTIFYFTLPIINKNIT